MILVLSQEAKPVLERIKGADAGSDQKGIHESDVFIVNPKFSSKSHRVRLQPGTYSFWAWYMCNVWKVRCKPVMKVRAMWMVPTGWY